MNEDASWTKLVHSVCELALAFVWTVAQQGKFVT